MSSVSWRLAGRNIVRVEHGTFTGELLAETMSRLCLQGYSQVGPVQQPSAFQIHADPNVGTSVFLAGPPARYSRWADDVIFKQEAFYSMCWNTPVNTVVAMTFSASAQCYMEWLPVFRTDCPYRVLVVVPALLPDVLREPDAMFAAYLPVCMVQQMKWDNGKLDAGRTIRSWLGAVGRLVTIGMYLNAYYCEI